MRTNVPSKGAKGLKYSSEESHAVLIAVQRHGTPRQSVLSRCQLTVTLRCSVSRVVGRLSSPVHCSAREQRVPALKVYKSWFYRSKTASTMDLVPLGLQGLKCGVMGLGARRCFEFPHMCFSAMAGELREA
jgi:hypothetical protein